MKRIINGKKYDTETAKELFQKWSGESVTDFNYYEESLYQKKTGEFFLAGEGGAMSKYAHSCEGNCWGYGKGIIPLTLYEAKEWVETNQSVDDFEELFGSVEE